MTVISLHAYLDKGGELEVLPFLDILAESIVVDRQGKSEAWLREAALSFRQVAGTLLADPQRHELATLLLWEAEAYENRDVAERFEQALPRHKLAELLAGSDHARHPHRLLVTGFDGFTCGACGDDYDDATAVLIDGIEGLAYCSACVGMASLALGNHRGPGRVDSRPPALAAGDLAAMDDRSCGLGAPVGGPVRPAEPRAPSKISTDAGSPTTALDQLPVARACRRQSRVRAQVAAALFAGVVTGTAGLASAGVLPARLQSAAHDTLARVGISVPDPPSSGAPDCPDGASSAPATSATAPCGLPDGAMSDQAPGHTSPTGRAVLQSVPAADPATVADSRAEPLGAGERAVHGGGTVQPGEPSETRSGPATSLAPPASPPSSPPESPAGAPPPTGGAVPQVPANEAWGVGPATGSAKPGTGATPTNAPPATTPSPPPSSTTSTSTTSTTVRPDDAGEPASNQSPNDAGANRTPAKGGDRSKGTPPLDRGRGGRPELPQE